MATASSPVSLTDPPSSSVPVTVTVSWTTAPALPATGIGKVQLVLAPGTSDVPMSPAMVGAAGQSQPHPNMQPFLVVNFCIALEGIFPSRG